MGRHKSAGCAVHREKSLERFHKEVMAIFCGAVIYHTWRARNGWKFRAKHVNTNVVVTQIKTTNREITYAQHFQESTKM